MGTIHVETIHEIGQISVYNEDTSCQQTPKTNKQSLGKKIFIIHGRDMDFLIQVKNFLCEIGFCPIILSEASNHGKTLLEKFESYADDVDFAIALFSPDDIGGYRNAKVYKERVRQNVIFELGYFCGRLGRANVSVLMKGNVDTMELPSDINGLVVSLFDDKWKSSIVKELIK